jgi:hypothetical protein
VSSDKTMIKVPYKERIEFWKFQNASITFSEVIQLCDLILKQKIVSGHPLHTSLMTALHILYGRPFKQRTEVRISENIVPAKYKDTHDALISMRDQIYAHTDVDGPKTVNADSSNKVGVFISGGNVRFALAMAFPRDVQKIRDLVKILSDKTWYHAEKNWQRHFKNQFVKDGNYEVNISKTDDSFLETISW